MSAAFEKACNKVAEVDSLFGPIMEFGVASGSVILLFVARDDIYSGVVTLGTFVAFQRYIQKMVWPMTALGMGLSMFQKGFASFDRMRDVLVTETDVPDTGTQVLSEFHSLEFQNVTFTFPDSSVPVLKNISFSLRAGETLGVMGPVGAGKTTLLHLILRLYPLKQGRILINGTPAEDYTLASLRKVFLLVPQESFLFSETVSENIAFGLEQSASDDEIIRMTEIVDIAGEIEALPQKYESQLGERGVNLSGGQKQRLTLARGLILRSPVLILDDSLSAVDTKTEQAIEKELAHQHGQTRLIVAHRLSTLKSADRILVLRDGELEAQGSPEELARTSPTFQRIVAIQNEQAHSAASSEGVLS
jgi:ATP-binding cassette subfamily B protein